MATITWSCYISSGHISEGTNIRSFCSTLPFHLGHYFLKVKTYKFTKDWSSLSFCLVSTYYQNPEIFVFFKCYSFLPDRKIISLLFMAEKYTNVYKYHISFIHSLVSWQVGWLPRMTIVNSPALNMDVQVFLLNVDFGYVPRSDMEGSYGTSMLFF
jgi:hypothetical protein